MTAGGANYCIGFNLTIELERLCGNKHYRRLAAAGYFLAVSAMAVTCCDNAGLIELIADVTAEAATLCNGIFHTCTSVFDLCGASLEFPTAERKPQDLGREPGLFCRLLTAVPGG